MSPLYVALLASDDQHCREADRHSATLLHEMGMAAHILSPSLQLYAPLGTPVHHLPDGAVLIGQAVCHDGSSLEALYGYPKCCSRERVRQYLLGHCWGEYVLVQPETDSEPGWSILRDPSGAVSCVYSIQQGTGFITSDISLAVRLGLYRRRVAWSAIRHRLTYPYLKTSRTCLEQIHELLPGCSLHHGGAGATTQHEWSPWTFADQERRYSDPREAATDLRRAVMTAVAAAARTDESVLLELSGGLDSSIIAACLRGTGAHVTCCTLVTPVPGADERPYAGRMADYLGVELRSLELTFENARISFEPPAHSVNPGMAVLQYAVNEQMEAAGERYGVQSFLSGGGGDNVFPYLKGAAPAVDAFKERGFAGGLSAIRDLSELHQCTLWKVGHLTLKKLLAPTASLYKAEITFLDPQAVVSNADIHPWLNAPNHALPGDRERVFSLAATQTFRDGVARGAKRRFHMPLLSQPVMETCLKVPTWMWIAGGRNRAVARSAFSDLLPLEVQQRRSKGTFLGYSGAIYRRNRSHMRDLLLTGQLQANGLLDRGALDCFLKKDLLPRDRSFMRLFELCMVENWVRHQT